MTATYEKIATTTLGSSQSSVTFSAISGSYTDLVIVSSFLCSIADYGITYQFNSDTGSNYSSTYLGGSGSSASSGRTTNYNFNNASLLIGGSTTERMLTIINIMNYSNSTTYKTAICRSNITTGTYPGTEAVINLWRNTNAITSIVLKSGNGSVNFSTGSTFTLYGIKAE